MLQTMNGLYLKELPLKKVTGDFYITEQFKIPSRTDMLDIVVSSTVPTSV